jgi:CBS domain-containing protein
MGAEEMMMSAYAKQLGRMTVADLMVCELVTVTPETSVREFTRTLTDYGITGAPVVEHGKVLGVVTSTDVLWLTRRAAESPEPSPPDFDPWQALDEFRVRDIMSADVFAVDPSADLDALRCFFLRTGVHRALVTENGVLVGIVSISDLLGAIAGGEVLKSSGSDKGLSEIELTDGCPLASDAPAQRLVPVPAWTG